MDDELQDETEEDFEGHLPPIFPRSRAELPCLHLGSVPRYPLPSHSAHLDIHSVDVLSLGRCIHIPCAGDATEPEY